VGIITLEGMHWAMRHHWAFQRNQHRQSVPSAIQIRFGGAKGMLCLWDKQCVKPLCGFQVDDHALSASQRFVSMHIVVLSLHTHPTTLAGTVATLGNQHRQSVPTVIQILFEEPRECSAFEQPVREGTLRVAS
jgi:hypothetical protein